MTIIERLIVESSISDIRSFLLNISLCLRCCRGFSAISPHSKVILNTWRAEPVDEVVEPPLDEAMNEMVWCTAMRFPETVMSQE